MTGQRDGDGWWCKRCGSPRWVSVSFTRGMTFMAQCVPCGHVQPRPGADGPVPRSALDGGEHQ